MGFSDQNADEFKLWLDEVTYLSSLIRSSKRKKYRQVDGLLNFLSLVLEDISTLVSFGGDPLKYLKI